MTQTSTRQGAPPRQVSRTLQLDERRHRELVHQISRKLPDQPLPHLRGGHQIGKGRFTGYRNNMAERNAAGERLRLVTVGLLRQADGWDMAEVSDTGAGEGSLHLQKPVTLTAHGVQDRNGHQIPYH